MDVANLSHAPGKHFPLVVDANGGLPPGVHYTSMPVITLTFNPDAADNEFHAKDWPAGHIVRVPGTGEPLAVPSGAELALAHPEIPIGSMFTVTLQTVDDTPFSITDSLDGSTQVRGKTTASSRGGLWLKVRRYNNDIAGNPQWIVDGQ